MNIAIIDIGTQSLKHYIFEIEGTHKKALHYKRYSDADLGESETINPEAIKRTLELIGKCMTLNQSHKVTRLQILGTDILRKASNAAEFTAGITRLSGHDIQIISQDQEARYLYDGFVDIVPDGFDFAAMNIGGGSTEVVIGNKDTLTDVKNIPFGVKFLKKSFLTEGGMDWQRLDGYLAKQISMNYQVDNVFFTGVRDFLATVGPRLGLQFEANDMPNHPIKVGIDTYVSFLDALRHAPIQKLKSLYPKDPAFCDNVAIGQSVYVAIAGKLSATTIIPSNNDLTDGVIHQLRSTM